MHCWMSACLRLVDTLKLSHSGRHPSPPLRDGSRRRLSTGIFVMEGTHSLQMNHRVQLPPGIGGGVIGRLRHNRHGERAHPCQCNDRNESRKWRLHDRPPFVIDGVRCANNSRGATASVGDTLWPSESPGLLDTVSTIWKPKTLTGT